MSGVRGTAEAVTKGLVFRMLNTILYNSPQFSGDFAANWRISIGTPDYTFEPISIGDIFHFMPRGSNPRKQGDPVPINKSLARMPALAGFKLGQVIWLTNSAYHDESYAILIEENRINFRPENPSGGRVVAKAIQMVQSRYSRISKNDAMTLAKRWV